MSVQKFTLSNGVRILVENVDHVGSASIGLWVRTGSANEFEDEAGISHFIEHMLFKGTSRRSAIQIAEEIEGRGGMLNAFTDKQNTCYYCRVLAEEAENSIDVLCDMLTDSLFDSEELEREKGVVVEEIRRGEDEPSDKVHDLHVQARWQGHPLGLPVIGTIESVRSFDADDLRTYLNRRGTADRIVLSVAGNVDPADVLKWAESRLGDLKAGDPDPKSGTPVDHPVTTIENKEIEQVHFVIGGPSASLLDDENRHATAVLDSIMGGGMSSRLFQEVREKRGLAYAIGTYSATYIDGAMLNVYGGTSPQTWDQVQEVVRTEQDKIMQTAPDSGEMERIKKNMSGGMVLGMEGLSARMMRNARSELARGRIIPMEETLERIESVTAEQVQEQAQLSFDPSATNLTAIGPLKT